MNKDYIKNLEASQMKESVDAFSVVPYFCRA